MLTVVKVGGAWLEGGTPEEAFRQIADIEGELVLVHGGGKEISRWLERVGVEVAWEDGLRVTRGEGLQLTAMVLSGWMNKRVAEALDRAGRPAIGISGEDGGLLQAEPLDRARFGEVGRIREVDPRPIRALLAGGYTPVVSPISRGDAGHPLNVNADEAALEVAVALQADRLFLMSDVPGVLDEGRLVEEIDEAGAEGLVQRGVLRGGMAVKVRQALAAAERGVVVHIGDEGLLSGAPCTRVLGGGSSQ
jgi:acetylglutamate kinase